jgi:hypothetical protein
MRAWLHSGSGRWFGLDVLAVFAIATAVRLVQIGHTGFYDEFYHILAAQSWVEGKGLTIGTGTYHRGFLYTMLIGWVFRFFSDGVVAARIPSVLAGAFLVALVYAWAKSISTRIVGGFAALLCCFDPLSLYLSQIARFYALHSLAFFAGSVCFYSAWVGQSRTWARLATASAAVLLLALATHFQDTTLIGLVGLVLWAILDGLHEGRFRWKSLAWCALAGVAVLLLARRAGFFSVHHLVAKFRAAPLWASNSADSVLYYNRWFLDEFPVFWILLPVAVLVTYLTEFRRPALFCSVTFLSGVAVHSFAGTKNGRYIAYLLPFLFVLWGITVNACFPWLLGVIREVQQRALGRLATGSKARLGEAALLLFVGGFLVVGTPAVRLTYRMLMSPESRWPPDAPPYRGGSDWERVAPQLRELSKNTDAVLSSVGVKALFYLGRFDFELSETLLREAKPPKQFGRDPRTGRRVVSTPVSLERIMECNPRGLVVIEAHHWRNSWSVSDAAAQFLVDTADPVELPASTRLIAYTWNQSEPANSSNCGQAAASGEAVSGKPAIGGQSAGPPSR